MTYRKNIKDIESVDIKGGDFHAIYKRNGKTKFMQMFKIDRDVQFCEKCGDYILDGQNHDKCSFAVVDEYFVANEIVKMANDDSDNIIEINKGMKDQAYIRLTN